MKLRWNFLTLLLLLSLLTPLVMTPATGQTCSFPVTMTDATGTEVTLNEEPSKVVTLSPSAAQTMWEIGADDKVVGVTKHASYLDGTESRTTVSTAEQMVSHETVVNLTPDLVLAPNVVSTDIVEKLREADVAVYYFPAAESIDDVYEKTHRIGRLTGECEGAERTVSWMQQRVNTAHAASENQERPHVLYLFFGYTAGEETFINEIIDAAGGRNIAAERNITGYQQINEEIVLQADPEWIILNSENPAGLKQTVINQTTAAEQDQIITIPIEHLNQPAPRITLAIENLSQQFHPEYYAPPNTTSPSTTASTIPTSPTPQTTSMTTTAMGTDTPIQPGFSLILTLGVVLLATKLIRRNNS